VSEDLEGKSAALPNAGGPATARPPSRSDLLRRIMGYGASRTGVEALLGARGVALASILGPELFGIWALFQIGLRYCAFAGLGMLRGLEVQVARADSKSERTLGLGQACWGRAVAAHSIALYALLSVPAVLVWVWGGERVASPALLGIALALLVDRLWMYGITFLRASGALRNFAILEFGHALLQLALTAGLALIWGLVGAFVGFALGNLAGLLLLARRVPLRPRWAPARVRSMVRIGFPVSLTGILTATLATTDRLLVGAIEGMSALGIYAFAVSLSGIGVSLALVIRTVILTDVYGGQGPEGESTIGRLLLDRTLAAYTCLAPPFAGAVALLLAPLVANLLPQYREAIPIAQLFVFTGVVQGIVNVAILGVVAANRQRLLPPCSIAAVIVNAVLCVLALYAGLGLVGVAVAALLTRVGYAVAVLSVPTSTSGYLASLISAARLLGPSVWCAAAVVGIGLAVPAHDLASLALALLLYAASMLVLLPRIRRTLLAARSDA
jgi:O-antigen/teichoic acid export membrane protein